MEPVTHLLTGACLSRAFGFPARARYATAACVIAAELPDADFVYRLGGPLVYFQHHRGWTHALWSLPLQAALLVGVFYGLHATRRTWKKRRSVEEPAPTRWLMLSGMALLALLSHLLLDWTNNYGIRPFAPFNPRWYAGELVYIVEPLLLLVLSLALLLPFLFSLVHREMGIRRPRYQGRALSAAALVMMVGLWGYRGSQRDDAATVVDAHEFRGGRIMRRSLNPYPIDPYRWHVVVETPENFQIGTVDTRQGLFETDPQQIYAKPQVTLATLAAKQSWLGEVYLDWSKFPLVVDEGTVGETHPELSPTPAEAALRNVVFSDLRFRYDVLGLRSSSNVLSAEAWVDANRRVQEAFLGGAEQVGAH
ncbi:metal-dependent hydrolase [Terriglobus roseus]|uniref:metal-dependent hydrolase n=1 Tax=Terriglobus roseus TaxID=392734 RepID=UPI000944FA40|nr:metal-dependent hydrolase [Terriglobus roseus]